MFINELLDDKTNIVVYVLLARCLSGNLSSLIRPEFFYFSFYRPSRPIFLEIGKKIKEIFFIFFFPPTVLEFSYVFLFCLFYCCQVD